MGRSFAASKSEERNQVSKSTVTPLSDLRMLPLISRAKLNKNQFAQTFSFGIQYLTQATQSCPVTQITQLTSCANAPHPCGCIGHRYA
jgi:hypothetical protein